MRKLLDIYCIVIAGYGTPQFSIECCSSAQVFSRCRTGSCGASIVRLILTAQLSPITQLNCRSRRIPCFQLLCAFLSSWLPLLLVTLAPICVRLDVSRVHHHSLTSLLGLEGAQLKSSEFTVVAPGLLFHKLGWLPGQLDAIRVLQDGDGVSTTKNDCATATESLHVEGCDEVQSYPISSGPAKP